MLPWHNPAQKTEKIFLKYKTHQFRCFMKNVSTIYHKRLFARYLLFISTCGWWKCLMILIDNKRELEARAKKYFKAKEEEKIERKSVIERDSWLAINYSINNSQRVQKAMRRHIIRIKSINNKKLWRENENSSRLFMAGRN